MVERLFDVFLDGAHLGAVSYLGRDSWAESADSVRRDLVENEGCLPDIEVREREG